MFKESLKTCLFSLAYNWVIQSMPSITMYYVIYPYVFMSFSLVLVSLFLTVV